MDREEMLNFFRKYKHIEVYSEEEAEACCQMFDNLGYKWSDDQKCSGRTMFKNAVDGFITYVIYHGVKYINYAEVSTYEDSVRFYDTFGWIFGLGYDEPDIEYEGDASSFFDSII